MDGLYSACGTIASAVQSVTNAVKFALNINYEAFSTVYNTVAIIIFTFLSVLQQVKAFSLTAFTYITEFISEIYDVLAATLTVLGTFLQGVCESAHSGYLTFILFCSYGSKFATGIGLALKNGMLGVFSMFSLGFDAGTGIMLSALPAIFIGVTGLCHCCVSFVTGVWFGLGFVLSSVAYFPVFCAEFVDKTWTAMSGLAHQCVSLAPNEQYLGAVVLCILYLVFSGMIQCVHSNRFRLFPNLYELQRRHREMIANHRHEWEVDRDFESDAEDMIPSDAEEREWDPGYLPQLDPNSSEYDAEFALYTRANNSDAQYTDDDDFEGDYEEGDGEEDEEGDDFDLEDSADSDELTVDDDSDSEGSLNSQTVSTASSDRDIDVMLPPQDACYSLRSRSSTPCRQGKDVINPDEFDREMEKERDKRKCVVCQDRIKSVLVMPCRHMCLCIACADHIVRSRSRRVCPLCRARIEKVMNVYV